MNGEHKTDGTPCPCDPEIIKVEPKKIPSVGRVVHYHSYGTPVLPDGTQKFPSVPRAAIVTEVMDADTIHLCVLNPTGMFFNQNVKYGTGPGCWSWPPKI